MPEDRDLELRGVRVWLNPEKIIAFYGVGEGDWTLVLVSESSHAWYAHMPPDQFHEALLRAQNELHKASQGGAA